MKKTSRSIENLSERQNYLDVRHDRSVVVDCLRKFNTHKDING